MREIGRALAASGGDQREGGAENGRRMERTRYALLGNSYILEEQFSPVDNVVLQPVPFRMEKRTQQLRVVNQVTQPNTPYGGS